MKKLYRMILRPYRFAVSVLRSFEKKLDSKIQGVARKRYALDYLEDRFLNGKKYRLTPTQQSVVRDIVSLMSAKELLPGLCRKRLLPTLIGPSGCGKTMILNEFANSVCKGSEGNDASPAVHIAINCSSWVPVGAAGVPTLAVIAERLVTVGLPDINKASSKKVVLTLDEISSVCGSRDINNSLYSKSVTYEIMSLLDRNGGVMAMARPDTGRKEELAILILLDNAWIIGAGSWQDLFMNNSGSSRTIASADDLRLSHVNCRSTADFTGDDWQLLNRFSPYLFLSRPTESDLLAAAQTMISGSSVETTLEPIIPDAVAKALGSAAPLRALEYNLIHACAKLNEDSNTTYEE